MWERLKRLFCKKPPVIVPRRPQVSRAEMDAWETAGAEDDYDRSVRK